MGYLTRSIDLYLAKLAVRGVHPSGISLSYSDLEGLCDEIGVSFTDDNPILTYHGLRVVRGSITGLIVPLQTIKHVEAPANTPTTEEQ